VSIIVRVGLQCDGGLDRREPEDAGDDIDKGFGRRGAATI
jgi:hypothetical protein